MRNALLPRLFFAMAVSTGLSAAANAEILGFGDFSMFTTTVPDSGSAPVVNISPDPLKSSIQLNTGKGEDRSIYYDIPQTISHGFTASFTYQMSGADGRDSGTGAAFVIQDSLQGLNAVTSDAYGYQGIAKSAAIVLDIGNTTGYFTNGNVGLGSSSTSPVNLRSGDPINVSLIYNGATLQETLTDVLTSQQFTHTYLITPSIATVLGSPTAYVGFTASVGAAYGTDAQTFSNFQFVPEPSTLVIAMIGASTALVLKRRRRRAASASR